jgi:hypothetical protein
LVDEGDCGDRKTVKLGPAGCLVSIGVLGNTGGGLLVVVVLSDDLAADEYDIGG